jgi:hypothetical protein
MLFGVELGYDFPEIAKPLKVLSDIFLRYSAIFLFLEKRPVARTC